MALAACGGRRGHSPILPSDIDPHRALSEDAIRIALGNEAPSIYDVRIAWAELVAASQRLKLRIQIAEQIRQTANEIERWEEADRVERAAHEKQIARDRLCTAVGLGACTFDVQAAEPPLAVPPDDDASGEVRIAREELRMAIDSYDLWHRVIGHAATTPAETFKVRLREIELALDVRRARAKLER